MNLINKEEFPEYTCPKCGWEGIDYEGFYYVKDGEINDCTEYNNEGFGRYPNPPEGYKAYPIYSEERHNMGAAMEFGGDPIDWDETYLCPNCNIEFTLSNSNC